jgi:hypothetical protein
MTLAPQAHLGDGGALPIGKFVGVVVPSNLAGVVGDYGIE